MATENTKTTEKTTDTTETTEPTGLGTAEETRSAPAAKQSGEGEAAEAATVTADRDRADETAVTADRDRAVEPAVTADRDHVADEPGHLSPVAATKGEGFGAGAAAVVSAGLGLCSLTGTSLADMLRARKEIIGQIEASSGGGGGDQVNAFYNAPWHTAAVLNGLFATAAVLIGGVLLALLYGRADARPWVKAVALGGVILGAFGLAVAGGMYFDLFASTPELPKTPPPMPGQ